MRASWHRGYVTPEQLKKTERYLAACRRQTARDRIAALSNNDIQILMADTIVDAITKRGRVFEADLATAGIPAHRIEQNKDAAMRLARQKEPRLDAMLRAGGAI